MTLNYSASNVQNHMTSLTTGPRTSRPDRKNSGLASAGKIVSPMLRPPTSVTTPSGSATFIVHPPIQPRKIRQHPSARSVREKRKD